MALNDSDKPFCVPLSEQEGKHVEKVCIDEIEVRWRIGHLMGEPVLLFSARWDRQPRIYLRGGTQLDPATAPPAVTEAFNKIGLVDLDMSATVVDPAYDGSTNYFHGVSGKGGVTFDIGVPAKSGGGFSFNVGGSPSWKEVFWSGSGDLACGWARNNFEMMRMPVKQAKDIARDPFGLAVLRVCDVDVSGVGSVDRALEQVCEPSVVARVQPRHCIEKEKVAEEPEAQEAEQDLEAMLDGVSDALDDRKRAEEARRKAEEQRRRLAAQEAERQRLAAERKRQHASKVSQMVGSSQNLGDVQTRSATLSIRAWDHGDEDGDRVQILINDSPVIDDWSLTNAGNTHTINLAPGYNAVKIKALNQNSGANTAAFIVKDGNRELANKSWDLETGDTAVLVVLRTGGAGGSVAAAGTGAPIGGGSGGAGNLLRDTAHIQCPSGVSSSIPVIAKNAQCMAAKKNFAQVMACNQVDDFQSAMATCASACGTQDCNDGL